MRFAPAFVLAVFLSATLSAHAIELAKDGKPTATIVIRDAGLKAKPYVPAAGVCGHS